MSHTELEPEIRKIQEQLQRMTSQNYADQLLQIIHRSGWTDTQAHHVRVMLDSMVQQLEGIDRAHRSLIQAAGEVGKARATRALRWRLFHRNKNRARTALTLAAGEITLGVERPESSSACSARLVPSYARAIRLIPILPMPESPTQKESSQAIKQAR